MLEILNRAKASSRKHPTRGTPPKLSNADKLLLLLMYYREYRTQFHIGVTYGISESRVCEIIKETERILINDARFHLPGKKLLLKEETQGSFTHKQGELRFLPCQCLGVREPLVYKSEESAGQE